MAADGQATTIRDRLGQRRQRRLLLRLGVVALVLLLVGLWAYRSYIRSVGGDEPGESVNLLVTVVEASAQETPEGPAPVELQAAAVVTLPPERRSAVIISLPASTRLGEDKDLAGAYREGGLTPLRAAVTDLLGVPIHHYVEVDLTRFALLVNRLPQGVPVTVRTPIVYRDASGEEIFRLDPGQHRLDGEAALYFLRYRGDDWEGEVPRAQRHREFVLSLARFLFREGGLQEWREFLSWALTQVNTDLDAVQAVRLAEMVGRMDEGALQFMLLPGKAEGGAWLPDEAEVQALVERWFVHQ